MANKGARLPVAIPNDLTPRQREVLALIAQGRTNFDIAQRLGISLEGVKYHVSEILQRLEVDSREEAAEAWRRERTPMRQVSRGLAAVVPLRLAAWVAGSVVAVGVVGLMVVALLGQFGGDDEDGGVATPTSVVAQPTATPGAEPPRLLACPSEVDDDICDFAAAAEGWVRTGDIDSLIGGGPFDTPTTRADLEQLLAGTAGGTWALRSIACPYVRGEPPEPTCDERFALVFSTFGLDGVGVDHAAMFAIGYARAMGGPEIQAYGLPDLDWQRSLIAGPLTQGDTLPGAIGGLGFRVYPVEVLPPGVPTPTPVPAVETIDGVAVRKLVLGAETTMPDDLVVYIQPVRWASESNPGLIRVYRDGGGSLRRDDLFERARDQLGPLALVSWAADEDFGTIVAASCGAPICEGVALGSWAGTFQLVRSTDGGISWELFGQITANSHPRAVTQDGVVVREWLGWTADDRLLERFALYPSGEELAPPEPFASPRYVPGVGLVWEPGYADAKFGAEAVYSADGTPIAELSAVPNLESRVSARLTDGSYVGTWEYVPDRPSDPHPRTTYIGMVDESGDPVALYTPGPVAPWITPAAVGNELLLSNAELPLPAGSNRIFYVPAVFIDLSTGRIHPLPELFEGIDEELQPRVQGAVARRVARVGTGDCKPVYPEPSADGEALRCYADGVLLFDEGETRIVDAVTWVLVTTPDGFEGWTDANGLVRRPG